MKLNDFLKVEKVRCVKAYSGCLTVGKEYSVLNIRMEVEVRDDEGGRYYWEPDHFEPVIYDMPKSAEKPLQDMKLTPEFEAAETVLADNSEVNTQDNSVNTQDNSVNIQDTPKFKVGDKVYIPGDHRVLPILFKNGEWFGVSYKEVNPKYILHATQENYEMLCNLYPHIEFELPPLTGNELCRKLLDKGEKYIMAKDDTDTWRIICDYCDDWFTDVVSGKCLKRVTPVNSKGEPLTEAVLDE